MTYTEAIRPPAGGKTIERALGVLDCFTPSASSWRTTDLARRCGLPVPTAHRILRVFENYGYVRRDPASAAYSLGPAAASLAREDESIENLRRAAVPALRALERAVSETVVLAVLYASRDHAVRIPVAESELGDPVEVKPLHAGAPAKVLLAELPNEELSRLLGRRLDRVGPATITAPSRLRREVAAIRRRRWAFSREEAVAGRWAVAVPVDRPAAAPVSIAIVSPLEHFESARAARYLRLLVGVARRISGVLQTEGGAVMRAGEAA